MVAGGDMRSERDGENTRSFDLRALFTAFAPVWNAGWRDVTGARLPRATGSVGQKDMTRAVRRFVAPEGFTAAAVRLAHDRLVVLCGAPGTGKRSSALSLLREVTDEAFYMFSPQIPLTELVEHDYAAGCGYLVIDHLVDRDPAESDRQWRLVRHRLASQHAYLVVTTTVGTGESVSHVDWRPPSAERVLRAHGAREWPAEHSTVLRDALRSADRVGDVVDLARRLRRGEPPHVAIAHFDATMRARIGRWFSTAPEHQILEVATLAFTIGVGERHFETALTLLWEKLAAHPGTGTRLRGRLAENPLITATAQPGGRALVFAMSGFHQHVLAELWQQRDVRFWDAVRDWLDTIVVRPPYEQRLPIGLAKLADAALDEVVPTLDRWALGTCGLPGQRAAVYTLWLMAHDDSLAPAALRIATRWINRGQPAHRWVAAMTFSGQLGVRYPHEAIDVLWRLCVQSHSTDEDVELVVGELFSTLVRETDYGGIVLTVLADKAERFIHRGAGPRMCAVAARAALAAVAVRDPLTDRIAVLTYLAQFPDRAATVAALLAKVLVKRPLRRRAMQALQAILADLAQHEELARALCAALASHLDKTERDALKREFPTVATNICSSVAALLNALQE